MNKIYLALIMMIILPLVSALDDNVVPFYAAQSKNYDIQIGCQANGGWFCTANTLCNMSLQYPNSSRLITNKGMTLSGSYINLTLIGSDTATLGRYLGNVKCTDTSSGQNASTDFILWITPNGSFDNSIGYFMLLGFGLLFTIGLIVFGFSRSEPYIVLFGALGLTLIGLYTFNNGISIYRNTITEPISLVVIFLSGYIGIRTSYEIVQDNL